MSIFQFPQSGRRMLGRAVCVCAALLLLTSFLTPLAFLSVTRPLGLDSATFATIQWANRTLEWYDAAFNRDGESEYVLTRSRFVESQILEEYYRQGERPSFAKLFASLRPVMEVRNTLKNVPAPEARCDYAIMARLAFRLGEMEVGQQYYERYERIERRIGRGEGPCVVAPPEEAPGSPADANDRDSDSTSEPPG